MHTTGLRDEGQSSAGLGGGMPDRIRTMLSRVAAPSGLPGTSWQTSNVSAAVALASINRASGVSSLTVSPLVSRWSQWRRVSPRFPSHSWSQGRSRAGSQPDLPRLRDRAQDVDARILEALATKHAARVRQASCGWYPSRVCHRGNTRGTRILGVMPRFPGRAQPKDALCKTKQPAHGRLSPSVGMRRMRDQLAEASSFGRRNVQTMPPWFR